MPEHAYGRGVFCRSLQQLRHFDLFDGVQQNLSLRSMVYMPELTRTQSIRIAMAIAATCG